MPNPTRISDLPLSTPQAGDFIPIARTTGFFPGTFKIFADQITASLLAAANTPSIKLTYNTSTRTLSAEATLIPVDRGGTGAVTPEQARINLGVVNKAGDNMTGFLTLNANPTQNLHAATKQYVEQYVSIANPFVTGMIMMWSGTIATIPSGWVLCNGSNGTPDLRSKFIVGAGSIYAVGATGGADTVTLTVDQMPAHDHGGTTGNDSPDHSHGGVMRYPGSQVEQNQSGAPDGPRSNYEQQTYGANTRHTHSIPSQGGNVAHENRPPYYALAFIMKL